MWRRSINVTQLIKRDARNLFKLLFGDFDEVIGAAAVGVRVLHVEVRERDVDAIADRSEHSPGTILKPKIK